MEWISDYYMDRQNIIEIFVWLKKFHPGYFEKFTKEQKLDLIAKWQKAFADTDKLEVWEAVAWNERIDKRFPTIEKIQKRLSTPPQEERRQIAFDEKQIQTILAYKRIRRELGIRSGEFDTDKIARALEMLKAEVSE